MEFLINDPNLIRYPPSEIRLVDLHVNPDPGGKRLQVGLETTPFQKSPEIELNLTDSIGREVSSATIIEPVGWKLELTMHIRKTGPTNGKYTLSAILSYPELGEVDRRHLIIEVPVFEK